jgi:methionyl-tRNA formyltransferase
MKPGARLVFFGNERLATGVVTKALTLKSLLDRGYEVTAVVVNQDAARSRSKRSLEIESVAQEHRVPVLLPSSLDEIKTQLTDHRAAAGVLVAYGKIVPRSIIDLFPAGIINLHPSLLPLHRGPTPIEQTILDSPAKTGISIMKLTSKMDAGPLFAQTEIALTGSETKQALADRLLEAGSRLLIERLPEILSGIAQPAPQDDTKATYCTLISKTDGLIDWHSSAVQIEREIRAYAGWPGSRTTLAGKDIIITGASLIKENGTPGHVVAKDRRLLVYCGKDALLIEKLKPAGKKEMAAAEFLAGHKISL